VYASDMQTNASPLGLLRIKKVLGERMAVHRADKGGGEREKRRIALSCRRGRKVTDLHCLIIREGTEGGYRAPT